MGQKSTNNMPANQKGGALVVLPTPRAVNLHNLESVRREMARVYRGMENRTISTQDGARLVWVLGEIRKMFEICDLEKRLAALEVGDGNH